MGIHHGFSIVVRVLFLLLYVCICMCLHVWGPMCGQVRKHMHIHVEAMCVFLGPFTLCLLSSGLSLSTELSTVPASLSSLLALGLPSLPSECWDYREASPPAPLLRSAGDLNSDLHSYRPSVLSTEPSHHPTLLCYSMIALLCR